MNIEQRRERQIEFEKIRGGTVFECDGTYYLKGKVDAEDVAVNLITGWVVRPDGSERWSKCRMHPKASIKF